MAETITPVEQLTRSTVRIECRQTRGTSISGTGFFYDFCRGPEENYVPAIVTNKHVLHDAAEIEFVLTVTDGEEGGNTKLERMKQKRGDMILAPHPSKEVDLCAILVAPLFQNASNFQGKLRYTRLGGDLLPNSDEIHNFSFMEDVLMIGYPVGLWDDTNNQPIIRRGVTATHPSVDFQGRKEFMIDCACYPGSSGSPVFIYNSGVQHGRNGSISIGSVFIRLLGIMYAGPQYTARGDILLPGVPSSASAGPVSMTAIPINLGYVVKAERLLDLDAVIRKLL